MYLTPVKFYQESFFRVTLSVLERQVKFSCVSLLHKVLVDNELIKFCTDIMTQLPGIVGPALAVTQVVIVPCEEQQVIKVDGTATVVVPAPHSHFEARPITCHLLSAQLREGMVGLKVGPEYFSQSLSGAWPCGVSYFACIMLLPTVTW